MKKFKFLWNLFGVFGFINFIGIVCCFFIIIFKFDGSFKNFGRSVYNQIRFYNLKKTARMAKPEKINFPVYDSALWKGIGARRERKLKPVFLYQGREPIPEEWLKKFDINSVKIQKSNKKVLSVKTSKELLKALNNSSAGNVILISPGKYRLNKNHIYLKSAGLPDMPIVVRAKKLGDVIIELNSFEGFIINKPYWSFENLIIRGTRKNHNQEHAFHIVGSGRGFVLRNSVLYNFNSIIKVNGSKISGGKTRLFPDYGLIENCTFFNNNIRQTSSSVNAIDIVGANFWKIRGNFISDFSKGNGDRISYAAFIKGNSKGGVFENNLVIGEYRHSGGIRVGLSFGGGGTGQQYSRSKKNEIEHSYGIIRNNIIMYFNDVGIYLNKSSNTKIFNNNILYTTGLDVRFKSSSVVICNNIIDSKIRSRNHGIITEKSNNLFLSDKASSFSTKLNNVFDRPKYFDFNLKKGRFIIDKGKSLPEVYEDIFGKQRNIPDIGAIEYPIGKKNFIIGDK
ncbi:MAG: hypothetical protein CSB21_01680 [Deltaproteobacteria bacterium]|nr:MAG: hypothetical protein CSB21_01680 [Deltaproteobacteria bacterium]